MKMRRIATAASVVAATAILGGAAAQAANVPNINVAGAGPKVAVNGYDVLSFWTDNKAVAGKAEFSTVWQGAEWRFKNAEHLRAFKAAPASFAPQYGGYSALDVAEQKAGAHPLNGAYAFRDGKLYLFHAGADGSFDGAKQAWAEGRVGAAARVVAADRYWARVGYKSPARTTSEQLQARGY